MRISFRKTVLLAVFCASSLCLLTGCEPSERKVLSSSYYKELQQENQKLEKQVEKLQEEAADNSPTVDEERAVDYLDKIARDNLVRLEVGYADNMDGSEFVDNEAAFTFATLLAKRADLTQKYTPEEVEEMYGPGYEYILYDEDNAVYEVYVYGGNYVVFTDLPNNVYYVYNASALGDAFLHYRNGYPNSSLLHRLADSALIIDEAGMFYENETAFAAANSIDQMEKERSNRREARRTWRQEEREESGTGRPKPVTYTFYHHGNTMVLTMFDSFYYIENMDGKRTWYRAAEEDVNQLKDIFTQASAQMQEEINEGSQNSQEEETEEEPSHSSEIEEESDVSSLDEEE